MREVKRGDPEPLFVSLIVLFGEAHGRAAQSGTKYCVGVDFSKANGRMHWPAHFVPNSKQVFDASQSCNCLTAADICKGFWNVPVAEECIPYCGVVT